MCIPMPRTSIKFFLPCHSLSNLNNIHIKIHGVEKPFLCDSCGKGFKTTKQLRNHKVRNLFFLFYFETRIDIS